jgi:predicted nucleic-acid-binding protein
MIAVDSNVLLRRVLGDEHDQAEKARRLFERETSILVTDLVLAETIWTLEGKRYRASRDDLVKMIMGLLQETNVVFESRQAIWSALNDYIDAPPIRTPEGMRRADFADALIVSKAVVVAQWRSERYGGTFTYDRAALGLAGTTSP